MDQSTHHSDFQAPQALTPSQSQAAARLVARGALALAVIAVVVLVWKLIAGRATATQLQSTADAQAAISVATIKPQALSAQLDVVLPGSLQANYEAPIYARTSGYLKRWLVDIGTPVKARQLLGEIESPEVDQQLRQAEADLATVQANQKIAKVTADRWRHLRNSDSVSKQDADQRVSLADSADAQVNAAQANVQRLRELAGFERVLAPFDGVVTARNTDIGQLINAGSGTGPELFRVADVHKLRLYVRVPQTYAALMTPGLSADLIFPDRPGRHYTGKVDRSADAIDASTRTLLVQLLVDNDKRELLPGAYSEVRFELPPGAAGPTYNLPANVLLFRSDGLRVATVDGQSHVVLKTVTIGRDYGSDIEVVQGLTPDDQVILSPPDSLIDGAVVRVTNPSNTGSKVGRS
jgi:RND family efflux transporter MFP subunit